MSPATARDTLIPAGWFEAWADAIFATDPAGDGQTLRAPDGILLDRSNAYWIGKPYPDPAQITAPTRLIVGEWDVDTPSYMAKALHERLTRAPYRRLTVLPEGTHTMLMERNRMRLFEEVQRFFDTGRWHRGRTDDAGGAAAAAPVVGRRQRLVRRRLILPRRPRCGRGATTLPCQRRGSRGGAYRSPAVPPMHKKTPTGAAFPAVMLLAVTLLATGCSDSAKDTHPQQLLSKRKAVFKQFTGALEPLGLMARDRKPWDATAFKAGALELQRLSTLPWPYFTADGNYPPTRAKPAVWDQPAEFQQAQEKYLATLAALLAAAERGGAEAGRPAVEQVEKACKSCHDRFRNAAPGG